MAETKNSGQPENDAGTAAATNVQANDDAASTETLSDIEKKEVAAQTAGSVQEEGSRSASEATPDGQFDGAGGEGTRGKDDGGPM